MPFDPTERQGPGPSGYLHQLRASQPVFGNSQPRRAGSLGASPMRGRLGCRTKGGLCQGYWLRATAPYGNSAIINDWTTDEVNARIDLWNEQLTSEFYSDIFWEWEAPVASDEDGILTKLPPEDWALFDLGTRQWASTVAIRQSAGVFALDFWGAQMSVNRGRFINVYVQEDLIHGGLTNLALADEGELDGTPKQILLPHVTVLASDYAWHHMIFFEMSWEQYQAAYM